jgi:peptidoglycan/xylan/chitin deacetylase (PgdA/CDA1 family)
MPISVPRLVAASLCLAALAGCGGEPSKPPLPTTEEKRVAQEAARAAKFQKRAEKEEYRSAGEIAAQHQREIRKGIFYPKLLKGDPTKKQVALTFDDGPHAGRTELLLDILKQNHVKATFFVVGKMAEAHPDLVIREAREGHLVANHSYTHVNLSLIPEDEIAMQYRACNDLIFSLIHQRPQFCRPPGGQYDEDVMRAAHQCGMVTVMWTDDPGDYARPADGVIESRILDNIGNGAVVLLHDGVPQTLACLPRLIAALRARGYTFVRVDQMYQDLQAYNARMAAAQPKVAPKPTKEANGTNAGRNPSARPNRP